MGLKVFPPCNVLDIEIPSTKLRICTNLRLGTVKNTLRLPYKPSNIKPSNHSHKIPDENKIHWSGLHPEMPTNTNNSNNIVTRYQRMIYLRFNMSSDCPSFPGCWIGFCGRLPGWRTENLFIDERLDDGDLLLGDAANVMLNWGLG